MIYDSAEGGKVKLTGLSKASRLLPAKRHQLILQFAREHGVLSISDLARELDVSEMTIRRDLDTLEKTGHIERKFGGAVLVEQAPQEISYKTRLVTNKIKKDAIGRLAATFVQDGNTVAIDASTTGLALARQLVARRQLTIVTNGLDLAQELRFSQVKVMLLGGWVRPMRDSIVGPWTLQTLENVRVDLVFFSSHGMLIPDGFFDADFDEIEVKRAMLKRASKAIALIDSSKFGKHALGYITGLSEIDHLITDGNVSPDILWQLEKIQVNVGVAELPT